jgi:hypothetical protein
MRPSLPNKLNEESVVFRAHMLQVSKVNSAQEMCMQLSPATFSLDQFIPTLYSS